MSDILKLVGEKIRSCRKEKGLSQEQLGELCGFHFSYIGGVERGERNLSLENIAKIAEALHIEPKVLFEFDISTTAKPEADTAIEEIVVLLRNKDKTFIQKIKRIIADIISLS